MFNALQQFFLLSVFGYSSLSSDSLLLTQISVFGKNLTFVSYLSNLCALISLIFIFVLCCLFVYKIIKLIGGLIR